MAQPIDFSRPFSFMFKDPNWLMKVVMGAVWTLACLVLIGIPVILGYARRTFLARVENDQAPLPEWNFSKDLEAGLPLLGGFVAFFVVCLAISFVLGYVPCVGWCASALVPIALGFFMPAVFINVSVKGTMEAAFDFGWIVEFIRANLSNYALAFVIGLIAGIIAQFGVILVFIGVFLTSFWSVLVNVDAYVQVYASSRGSVVVTPAPPQA